MNSLYNVELGICTDLDFGIDTSKGHISFSEEFKFKSNSLVQLKEDILDFLDSIKYSWGSEDRYQEVMGYIEELKEDIQTISLEDLSHSFHRGGNRTVDFLYFSPENRYFYRS